MKPKAADFDLAAWLESLGLSQYTQAFLDHEIDREALLALDSEDLKECGVGPLGHRKKLLTAIQALAAEPAQAEPVQAEPVQAEPVQAEPVQVESVQVESVQAVAPLPVAVAFVPEVVLAEAAVPPSRLATSASPAPASPLRAPDAVLLRQRRQSALASLIIALLAITLVSLLLAFIVLPALVKEVPVIVSYSAPVTAEERLQTKRISDSVERKPSRPSSSSARVIAAATASPVAVPVPDFDVTEPSLDFGNGNDFGEGWGSGDGDGMGGGGASFFQQNIKAQRVAYVIDFSQSMKGERDRLMRKELAKSIEQLSIGMQYQMIFFSGPVWVAGDKVAMPSDRKTATVNDGRYRYGWTSPSNVYRWSPKGRRQVPDWLPGTAAERRKSLDHIKKTPLVAGTTWDNPLEMAFAMRPAPEVIFFMTDGAVEGIDTVKLARSLGSKARSKRIIVNTIALMEPKANAGMKELAKTSGGQFTIVEKSGKVRVVPLQ